MQLAKVYINHFIVSTDSESISANIECDIVRETDSTVASAKAAPMFAISPKSNVCIKLSNSAKNLKWGIPYNKINSKFEIVGPHLCHRCSFTAFPHK